MLTLYDCATAPSPRRARILLAEKGVTPRVRQLCTQVSDFLVCRFQKCHYSRVICSGRRGLESLRVANKALCSSLVVDRPAEGCEPFKVMR